MKRRHILLAAVCLAVAPGTWVRTVPPAPNYRAGVEVERLDPGVAAIGPLQVLGLWQLTSRNARFGGYSGLVARRDGEMLAASDRGAGLRFRMGSRGPRDFQLFALGDPGLERGTYSLDIESITMDPAAGDVWLAYEGLNMIERRNSDLGDPQRIEPAAMADWGGNSGPEAMLRLADGRFVMLGEGRARWFADAFPGLLWPVDPVSGTKPRAFAFVAPDRFRPTDMAQLPDGRVLVLARRLAFGWPVFEAMLLVGDPAAITPGELWPVRELARLAPPFPTDNFEALAVDPSPDFPATITLISDDNGAALQRTLVLRLRWDGRMPQ